MNYLNYQGKKLPVRVSYYAIKHFQLETKRSIDDIDDDISLMEVLLYYGLQAGHKAEGRDLGLKKEDMEMVLDECLDEFIDSFADFFQNLSADQQKGLTNIDKQNQKERKNQKSKQN